MVEMFNCLSKVKCLRGLTAARLSGNVSGLQNFNGLPQIERIPLYCVASVHTLAKNITSHPLNYSVTQWSNIIDFPGCKLNVTQ